MPFLLRNLRSSYWYPATNGAVPSREKFPADPLKNFNTDQNTLSVYFIEDDKSNLERVVTALAAKRHHLANADYILFDSKVPAEMEIDLTKTNGGTHDDYVNKNWHRDLVGLTALKLVDLTVELSGSVRRERILKKTVLKLIRDAV